MPDYRLYKIGQDGHVVGDPIALTFDDDDNAIAFGEEHADTNPPINRQRTGNRWKQLKTLAP
jgi:hypothetical protein